MQRRKFLIGAGSIATGTAAAMGTGAFTSVTANRDVKVAVAGDSKALLRIRKATDSNGNVTPNAAEYVNISDGKVSLDFTSTDSEGSGINKNATTVFDNLLRIENQGTQEVVVGYTHPKSPSGGFAIYHEDPDLDELEGGGEQTGGDDNGTEPTNNGQLNIATAAAASDLPEIQPGEAVNKVGAYFFSSNGPINVSGIKDNQIMFQAGDDPEDLSGL